MPNYFDNIYMYSLDCIIIFLAITQNSKVKEKFDFLYFFMHFCCCEHVALATVLCFMVFLGLLDIAYGICFHKFCLAVILYLQNFVLDSLLIPFRCAIL